MCYVQKNICSNSSFIGYCEIYKYFNHFDFVSYKSINIYLRYVEHVFHFHNNKMLDVKNNEMINKN